MIAQQSSAAAPFVSVVASAPVRNDRTFYARHGDWFALANIVLFIALLASRWVAPGTPVVRQAA